MIGLSLSIVFAVLRALKNDIKRFNNNIFFQKNLTLENGTVLFKEKYLINIIIF